MIQMLIIPEITSLNSLDLSEASIILSHTPSHPIACNNWPESFPYTPQASFQMAYHHDELFIKFTVREQWTMAKIQEDNGKVWTDSCVEFFLALDESGYYNFEFTCIGKALEGFRKERPAATHASPEIMASIKRYPTLGTDNFEETQLAFPWELTVAIPVTALFRHPGIKNWSELDARMNVYKCGDKLLQPHYLSWRPINTEKPNFHVPQYFSTVKFQLSK